MTAKQIYAENGGKGMLGYFCTEAGKPSRTHTMHIGEEGTTLYSYGRKAAYLPHKRHIDATVYKGWDVSLTTRKYVSRFIYDRNAEWNVEP